MLRILATFALRFEFAPWRRLRDFRPVKDGLMPAFQAMVGDAEVTALLLGTGVRNLGALAGCLSAAPQIAIVAGVAGGLRPDHSSGDILVARSVSGEGMGQSRDSDDALVQAAVACGAKQVDRFLSSTRILKTPEERSRLYPPADALEMESLTVMNKLFLHGIPSVAVRAIADPVHVTLPCDFQAALDEQGEIRTPRILAQMVWAPWKWPGMISFALDSYRATVKLARFLDGYVQWLAAQ